MQVKSLATMSAGAFALAVVMLTGGACSAQAQQNGTAAPIEFENVTEKVGLAGPLSDWSIAHAAAWGDVNGDGRPDLYLGAFADREEVFGGEDGAIPNPLFLNTPDGFKLSPEKSVRFEGTEVRSSFAMLVDLDNDGDKDLFVGTHTHPGSDRDRNRDEQQSALFENTGGGSFRDVTPDDGEGGWPSPFAVRNATAIDFNNDGLLDLALTDGAYSNWRDGGGRLIILINKGGWQFEDASDRYGLPRDGTPGTGTAIGDVNDDGLLDIFVADANRLFVTQKTEDGWRFREAEAGRFVGPRADDRGALNCGAAFGDLNGDGKLDLVTTVHYQPGQIDVYLNRTTGPDNVRFEHVTEQVGLPMLLPEVGITGAKIKGAHVAIQDFDYDGRNDLAFAILWRNEDGEDRPLVLRNLGVKDGIPQFDTTPMERMIIYAAPAPIVDYDRDGRLDYTFVSWFSEEEDGGTQLFRNVTDVGNRLTVNVVGDGETVNTTGIGSIVRIYKAGQLGEPDALLGRQDVTIGQGYSGATEPRLYFGLGEVEACDVLVTYHDQRVERRNVKANQTITIQLPANE